LTGSKRNGLPGLFALFVPETAHGLLKCQQGIIYSFAETTAKLGCAPDCYLRRDYG
jgi:hypothetical protein